MAKRKTGKPHSATKQDAPPKSPEGGKKPSFELHEHIGRQLQGMFDEVIAEPVPEKFRQLLDELKQKKSNT